MSRNRLDQPVQGAGAGEYVDTQSVLLSSLGGLRANARHDCGVVWLARDANEVAHRAARGEQHRVETTGFDGFAHLGGRWRCPHGAISRDVFDLPAKFSQTSGQSVGCDIRAGQEDPVDWIGQ